MTCVFFFGKQVCKFNSFPEVGRKEKNYSSKTKGSDNEKLWLQHLFDAWNLFCNPCG